jgi:nitrate/nitrite-specific signal transduction histidine kinase
MKMKIQYKLMLSFSVLAVVFLIAGVIISANVTGMNALDKRISTDLTINQQAIAYQNAARDVQTGTFLYLQGETRMGNQMINEGELQMVKSRLALNASLTDPKMIADLSDTRDLEQQVLDSSHQTLSISAGDDPDRDQQIRDRMNALDAMVVALNTRIATFVGATDRQVSTAIDASAAYGAATVQMIVMGLGLVLVLSLLMAIVMARHLTGPITSLTETADRVSRGELKDQIEIKTGDEIENLADSFTRMINAYKMMEAMSMMNEEEA